MCFLFAEVWHVSSLSHWTSPTPLEPWCGSHRPRIIGRCFFFSLRYCFHTFIGIWGIFFWIWLIVFFWGGLKLWRIFDLFMNWWRKFTKVMLCGDRGWPLKHQFSTFQKCQSSHAHSGEARGDFRASQKKRKSCVPRVPWEFFVEFF